MTLSRLLGIISGIGALASGLAVSVNFISPKWGGVLAGLGGAIAMLTERAQGGLSVPEKRVEAVIVEQAERDKTPLPTVNTEQQEKM